MNDEWRDDLNKLVAGGCGTQIGMLFTCGAFASGLLVCAVCAFSSLLSVSFNDLAQALTAPQGEEFSTIAATDTQTQTNSMDAAVVLPAGAPLPTQVIVTTLPATGALPLDPNLPPPIITADQGKVNLRLGPSTEYPRIGLLPANASLEIVGRNQDGTWWLVSTIEGLAWVHSGVVSAANLHQGIPIIQVVVPPPSPGISEPASQPETAPIVRPAPRQLPAGTPTASANQERIFVQQTVGYKALSHQLATPPVSASYHPHDGRIAIMEGIKLHLVAGDGSYSRSLLDSNETYRLVGGAVWSPDGEHIAFVVDYKAKKCKPCRSVGIYTLSGDAFFFLTAPDDWDTDAPRWTQDGRLLVNAHPSEPADGITYLYDTTGRGQPATGLLTLSASHEGQKWQPWLPGRTWRAGVSERPDTYYD